MNTDDIVNQFANTLQNRNVRPSILYGDKKSDSTIHNEVKVKDVITIISKQLKAIKNADSVRREVKQRKSNIPPDNLTPVIRNTTENKYETQCILDTQLINLIQNAEAEALIDKENDEKESEIPFCQTGNNNLERNDVLVNIKNKTIIDIGNGDIKACENVKNKEQPNNFINTHDNRNNTHDGSGDSFEKGRNNCINDNFHDSDRSIELPSSPILRIVKTITKTQPLTYTLEEFDKFESLAAPVLKGMTDFEDAKQIINTQLKETSLFVKRHLETVTTDTNKNDIKDIEGRAENLNSLINNNLKTQYSFDINSGVVNNIIEDEMLFDSDDDIKCSEELPLTCALETSFYNNTEVLDTTMYVGFQTASNRSIQILSDSFRKAKSVFDNVTKTVAENLSVTELVEAFDRRTSYENGDLIKQNDIYNEIVKSKSFTPGVYHMEENTTDDKNMTKNENNRITEYIDEHIMREFENNLMPCESNDTVKSANKRKITHTDCNNLIDNNNKKYMETNISDKIGMDNLKRSNDPNFIGFKTASNKNITISDQALSKTKNIFEDIDLNNSENDLNSIHIPKEGNFDFVGFKTANNKKIKISAEAVLKSKNIFDNIDNDITSNCQININKLDSIKHNKYKTEPIIAGFIDSIPVKNIKRSVSLPIKETDLVDIISTKQFQLFKTASNKTVVISDNALENSKKIFQNIENDVENKEIEEMENKLYAVKNKTCLSFKGFKTANNKPIKISDEALFTTKKIFHDLNDTDGNEMLNENTFDNSKVQSSIQIGFKTANKKPVVLSQEALSKSKILFQDIEDKDYKIVSNHKNTIKKSSFAGFQTASNKSVKISAEALFKTRKIFQDIDFNDKTKDVHETDVNFKGFCTASNKRVHVTEDALVKSGKIFENLCVKNQHCEDELKKNIRAKLKNNVSTNSDIIKNPNIHKPKEIEIHKENKIIENGIKVEDFLNTEIINIFDESLHTEDFFEDTTPKCKRSGSPILSCSKTKKKKFEVPKSANKIIQRDIKTTKPLSLFQFDENYKKTKKYKLTDILAEKSRNFIKNIDPYILNFNFDTLLDFRFENNRNEIDCDSWTTGKIKNIFTDSVNKKIIPEGWIDNHIKLIIWKLISYEIFSPIHMKYICTVKNVLQQLKYRYDRELYNVERPALRKIMEKDDVSTKTMILCVASLYIDAVSVSSITQQNKNIELLLTDGWYCIKASADAMIDKLIIDGKISIGTKLAIHGAELTNCEQGISPWEDTSTVRLKISGNSTKRAKWDTRLGFHGNGAMMSPLTAVRLEGGKISKLRVFVTRVYPTMYIEKFEDGSTVTRSERLEHLHQMKCDTERQIQMEKLYEDVVKISEEESVDSEEQYTEQENLDTGSQISRLLKKSKDPLEFKTNLTSSQAHMLNEHTNRQNEKLIQKIQNRAQVLIKKRGLDVSRNVVPLMKMRVFDDRKATITIWRPNESLLDLIKEGSWIDVYNIVPTSIRYSEIQISAGRQSIFCKSKIKITDRLRTLTKTLSRKCYTVKDLQRPITTDYNEIDTFGFVFFIEPKDYDGTKELFQNVYLSDFDKNIISVNFWGGVKKFGYENILEVGQIVACINLQKRAGNTRHIPQYRATEYTYFTKTPKFDLARKLLDELSAKFFRMDKIKFIQDCTDLRNNYLNFKYSNTENVSPYRMNNSEYNISRNKMFIESPIINKELNSNHTLDKSKSKENIELSPNTLLRKKKVNEKIAKLKIYGEPPPLNHIHMINKSSNAIRPYKSPLISNDSSSSAANTNINNVTNTLSVNKTSSPVVNRTFVKLNPVKLNFALQENNFAEELKSPPLSLDLSK